MIRRMTVAAMLAMIAGGAEAVPLDVLPRPVVPIPAQYYEPGMPPWEAETIARSMGFRSYQPPVRSGAVWIVRAHDRRGTPVRVVIHAFSGDVLDVTAMAPPPPDYYDDDEPPARKPPPKRKAVKQKPPATKPATKPEAPAPAPVPPPAPAPAPAPAEKPLPETKPVVPAPAMPPPPFMEKPAAPADPAKAMPAPVEPAAPDFSAPAAPKPAPSGDIGPRVVPVPAGEKPAEKK